jgi:hypothetical protein
MKTIHTKTKTGQKLDIKINDNPDYGSYGFNKHWKYLVFEAFINSKSVGSLSVAYIDEYRKNLYFSDEVAYLKTMRYRHLNINNKKELNEDTVLDFLCVIGDFGGKERLQEKSSQDLLKIAHQLCQRHTKSYQEFIEYHHQKPEVNMVRVKSKWDSQNEDKFKEGKEHRRQGVATALYKVAVHYLEENKLPFYSSTTQTEDAKELWKSLKKTFKNLSYSEQEKRFIVNSQFIIKPKSKLKMKP